MVSIIVATGTTKNRAADRSDSSNRVVGDIPHIPLSTYTAQNARRWPISGDFQSFLNNYGI
eukprot:5364937-Pleurochrysis_carterae.AAC.1